MTARPVSVLAVDDIAPIECDQYNSTCGSAARRRYLLLMSDGTHAHAVLCPGHSEEFAVAMLRDLLRLVASDQLAQLAQQGDGVEQ